MTRIARAGYRLRRFLAERWGVLVAVAGAALVSRGAFAPGARPTWLPLAAGVALVVAIVARALPSLGPAGVGDARPLRRLELGLLLLAATYALLQVTGAPARPGAQPLAYLVLLYLVGTRPRRVAVILTLAALALQVLLHRGAGTLPGAWPALAREGAFLLAFAAAGMVFLGLEVALSRRAHRRRLDEAIRAMREEARDFRLSGSATTAAGRDRAADEAKLVRGAVEAIHGSMLFVLETLKRALDLQTCVLLWLDRSGDRLRIKELVTDSDMVSETPIPARAGALGGIVKNRLLLNLRRPPRGVSYYDGPEEVGAFAGVPVIEGGHLRGVLCADRRTDAAFEEEDERLLVEASRQVLRAIQTERVLAAVERSKYEHERFFQASSRLNRALTLDQVYDTALAAAAEIAPFDVGAVTLYDRAERKHTVCRFSGQGRERFEGQRFGDNAGLVAMVVKNRHFLPAGEGRREPDPLVFTRRLHLPRGLGSLLVLPLVVHDRAVGSLVLAARAAGRFDKQAREMLGVIANQVAVAVENAKMYRRMEEMATTDGLTALPNHRTFQARFSEMLQRAERHGKAVTVIITDVDRFKSVNDTYGHPVGDQVLKRVAAALAGEARRVDLVARYGGEEFALVLEETDAPGARRVCERIRRQVEAQTITCDRGTFNVTLSLGLASYPADGRDKATLIERADKALYHAKTSGRNRTAGWSDIARPAARPSRRAAADRVAAP